jgi:hypothetical protein
MSFSVSLTVSESKRLIAKGVVASEPFREALTNGRILIIKGTTNAYVVEETIGREIDKLNFARGLTLPHGLRRRSPTSAAIGDVLIDRGQPNLDADLASVVETLGPGDLILKGANALSYQRNLAGVLIGDPRSGTIGLALRRAVGSHVRLLVPVGLEKEIAGDLLEVAAMLSSPEHQGEGMMPVWGSVFTEIEALAVLADVRARHVASGGVSGAEGATWLAIEGDEPQLEKARAVLEGIYGEPGVK